jgi:hypothetical protein
MAEITGDVISKRYLGKGHLGVITAEPVSPDIVRFLELALDMAKSGELSSIALSYVFRDGSPGRGWSSPPSTGALIGSVAITQALLTNSMIE